MEYDHVKFVSALRNSDEVAFEAVFRDYYNRLCNYANGIVNDLEESEEMVQNTFLSLWEKRSTVTIHTSVKSYLYQAVHNNCLNRLKHENVRQNYRKHEQYTNDDRFDNVSQYVVNNELKIRIDEAIKALPDQCRRVFELSRFEYMNYADIAGKLNISKSTVEKHMIKALKLLREQLKDYLPFLLLFLTFNN